MFNSGYCTSYGTEAYRSRHRINDCTNFRVTPSNLHLSSIGIGTYLGNENVETDHEVTSAIYAMLLNGCNVIDTAPNYRNGRAESSVGAALQQMISDGTIRRDEVFVSTKVGIVPEYLVEAGCNEVRKFTFNDDILFSDGFCFDPTYLEWQLHNSLKSLMLDSVDCLYLHNIETLQQHLGKQAFLDRMPEIILLLERLVNLGYVRSYGISSWDAFRSFPDNPLHIDLSVLFKHLDTVGIGYDNFQYLQLPLGIWGTEAITVKSQNAFGMTPVSILNYALSNGITVFANSALLQGDLLRCDLSVIPGSNSMSEIHRAINFARSVPGVKSLIVGIKSKKSITDAVQVMKSPYFDFDDCWVE